ncbi:MAG: glycosyl hydrolase [Planctomycetota bacterium]|nr:glycosyl hydrolase [Planctomycetota bacterium]
MKRLVTATWTCLCFVAALSAAVAAEEKQLDSAAARKIFTAPPRQYATAPLWVWNDMLTDEQIRGTMRDLAGQKVMQVFVHPRPGLMTPYLSDEWFRLWKVALDEAEKLDMNVWIYDETSYPSGFAGGHVPELMPESRGRGLTFRDEKQPPKIGPDTVAVYRVTANTSENITEKLRGGESLAEGQYVVASVVRATNSPWHGDRSYVDLMYPGVTEKFLEVTLDAYKKNIGDQFGKRVLGSFTDEPNVRPAGGLPWTDHLPAEFQKRWGYSLLDCLPSLNRPVGNWKQVRHDYFQVVLEQYIEHWAKPYYAWCEKNGIAFTGHYWDHEWPHCLGVTDNMAMSAWQHIPGIDCLMNQYREDTHAQFGNVRFVREVQSLCNQLGRERYLCEIYGAGGWDLRFEDMKRIADWLGVLGVNLFDEHLSYVTLRGARKADHPQSFSYHEPWWDSYHVMAQYTTRLSAAMSMGDQRNRVLVLQPTTTAWMYQPDATHAGQLGEIGKTFFDLLMGFERAQVEYDIGCEDVIARHGTVSKPGGQQIGQPVQFVVGKRAYTTVVLPPMTETLRSETMKLFEEAAKSGLQILSCGPPPALVDGRPSDRGEKLAKNPGWQPVDPARVTEMLVPVLGLDRCAIRRAADDKGLLFHQRRQLADGDLLLLVNTSIDAPSRGFVEAQAKGVQKWDLFTGAVTAYPFAMENGAAKLAFELPPCGSLLLFLAKEPGEPGKVVAEKATPIAPRGELQIRRIGPNVLTLDHVDVTAGDETRKNVYYYRANQLAWQKNGLPRDPWDSAVQYKDELISKKFPPESGFEVTYRFTIEGAVPQPLWIVIERPDLYAITCNGAPITAAKDSWWLDKAFGKIDITAAAKPGENAVTLKAQPFTMYHEIAAAFVLGEFSLRPAAAGFVIVPPQGPSLAKGLAHATDIEGVAWMSSGIGYQRDPAAKEGNDGAPMVAFDLGRPVDLAAIEVWNYNEAAIPGRGVKKMQVIGSATPEFSDASSIPLGTFELARAPGGPIGAKTAFAQQLPVSGKTVRYVKFTILSNHDGVSFPTKDGRKGNAFAGLGEVRFHAAGQDGQAAPIAGVKIHSVSSELTSPNAHDRRAVHLVDGSGLGEAAIGWNRQGMPFYSAGVAYRQSFAVDKIGGRYKVWVPSWYGSVAKVMVNGKLCGQLVSQPWLVDVTDAVSSGENAVEVLVIGTLKNTLGPHHAGAQVGSAWPGMFQQGPANGLPPGSAYHTLGYGLFEPFSLLNVAP